MATVTFPGFPFLPGTLDPALISSLIEDEMSETQGELDLANIPAVALSRDVVRRGAISYGEHRGSTLNQDIFDEDFVELDTSNLEHMSEAAVAVPGATTTYRIKHESMGAVRLFWNMSFEVDDDVEWQVSGTPVLHHPTAGTLSRATDEGMRLLGSTTAMLFIDGVRVPGVFRRITSGLMRVPVADEASGGYTSRVDASDLRVWSGAFIVDGRFNPSALTRGWHTASIRISHGVSQVRIKVRSFGHMVVR